MHPSKYLCSNISRFVYCKDPLAEFGFRFEDIEFEAEDGFQLKGWYIPAKSSGKRKGVVLVHGYGVDRQEMMRYVPPLHKAGFQLLLFDLRNCGQSQKSFNSMGYFERKDALAAVHFLSQKKRVSRIGILGVSLGAATSIMTMAREPKIMAGFFEGGYASLRDVLWEQATHKYHLPAWLFVSVILKIFAWKTKADIHDISPKKDIAQIAPRPIYLVHGTDDRTVLFANADKLFQAALPAKKLYMQKDGYHAAAWNLEPQKIEKMVSDFFKKHVK